MQYAVRLLHHITLEVGHVRGCLETNHVVGKQRLDQPGMVGDRDQHIRRREWNMQEKSKAGVDAAVAQLRAQRDQVIVVNPHQVLRRDQRRQLIGDHGVGAPVTLDECRLEVEKAEAVVK